MQLYKNNISVAAHFPAVSGGIGRRLVVNTFIRGCCIEFGDLSDLSDLANRGADSSDLFDVLDLLEATPTVVFRYIHS